MTYGTTSYTRENGRVIEHFGQLEEDQAKYRVEASTDYGVGYATNNMRWPDLDSALYWAQGLTYRWLGATNVRVVREEDNSVVADLL